MTASDVRRTTSANSGKATSADADADAKRAASQVSASAAATPRAAPYEGTWAQILACGDALEASLEKSRVRLTMGGEPTFVPTSPIGDEWQTAALGPTKLGYARRLAHELIRTTYPGAVLLETSGKHYPGEPLPRWTLLTQQLADGRTLWKDPTRLCSALEPGTHASDLAQTFVRALARTLALDPARALPLCEPDAPAVEAGWVLPLDRDTEANERPDTPGTDAPGRQAPGVDTPRSNEPRWISDDWTPALGVAPLRLLPGESLAGFRLPLSDLPEKYLRRALTAEIRDGRLTIFLPPLLVDDYAALLAAVEDVLVQLALKDVVLAGYAPPPDPALTTVGLASDPGVLEINVSPSTTWVEYDAQLEQLYVAAHAVGLVARKLQYNGREVGTGGGAHLVFGGPSGPSSPFFTSPALLPSLIRYWQRHPSLSYAFAGGYLGPSSQAPRIDESTFEALYELEIACAGAESVGTPQNLALFDLLFRDLLMDRSGNTHRAEISVDKLWNPFAPNGRLGLVELRSFETHPLREVQSVTALFVRAILARLAADPFKEPFIRWGGELHDRFFLPAFVLEDLTEICTDLAEHGTPFDPTWLLPAWEFRFPKLGEFALADRQRGNFSIELRQALEAWPLLGESPNAGTSARTVDSSLDRIEARVSNAEILEGGMLLVNGLPCEFRPTADSGAACGIRYRAFYLTPSLQPHVPVHAPLLIEWVDRATLKVAAAARWHVWNPRNAPYEGPPPDDDSAAARRAERWEPWTATLGQARFIPRIDFPPEGTHTLDLRRYPAQSR